MSRRRSSTAPAARRGWRAATPSRAAAHTRRGRAARALQGLSGGARLTVAFGLVVVLATGLLGAAFLTTTGDHDWHPAVTIDGAPIGRADFRNRSSVLEVVALARTQTATRLAIAGVASITEQSALGAAASVGDPITATVDSLVRERVVRDEAAATGITLPTIDVWAELAAAACEPSTRHVRWIVIPSPIDPPASPMPGIGWSVPPSGGATAQATLAAREAAMAHASELLATTPVAEVIAAARSAGWDARGSDTWIPDHGRIASIPDILLTLLRDPGLADGAAVGPLIDEAGAQGVAGVLLGRGPAPDVEAVRAGIEDAKLDEAWLRPWAEGRVLERLLEASKIATWTTTPSVVVREREVVVGTADLSGGTGPHAGLAHLVLDHLPAGLLPALDSRVRRLGGSSAHVLARQLRAMALAGRLARWDDLVAAANARGVDDPLQRSGEIGWLNADALIPGLARAAFADTVNAGSVIGPITTSAGTELFLVRGTYPGTLDERAAAVLTELLTTGDLGAVARRIAPRAEGVRFDVPLVRSELETFDNDPAHQALFVDALDALTRPFVLDGEILLAVPLERRTEVPSGQPAARIRAGAFDAWLGERMATRVVEVDPDPYGITQPSVSPSPSASVTLPTVPPMPTPFVPAIPGQSLGPAATPDPFTLPTIAVPGLSLP